MAGLFHDGLGKTDAIADHFVSEGFNALSSHYGTAVHSAFVLYVMMLWLWGWKGGDVKELVWLFAKGLLIYIFALSWTAFAPWFYNLLTDGPRFAGGLVLQAMGNDSVGADPRDALDLAFTQAMQGAKAFIAEGFGAGWLAGAFVFIGACVFFGLTYLILQASKIGLTVLITFAPVFFPMLFFPWTMNIFGAWLRSVIAFAFLPMVALTLTAFGILLIRDGLAVMQTGQGSIEDAFIFMLASIVGGFLIMRSEGMAAGLAGSSSHGVGMGVAFFMTSPFVAAGGMAGRAISKQWDAHKKRTKK